MAKLKMKRITKYLILVLIVLAVAGYRIYTVRNAQWFYYLEGEMYYKPIEIGTFSSGSIEELNIEEGQIIEENQVLMKIKNDVLTQRLEGAEQDGTAITQADLSELRERVANLEIRSPVKGYVLNIDKSEKSYVKESDVVATVVPLDKIEYAAEIEEIELERNRELQEYISQKDQEVFVQLYRNGIEIPAKTLELKTVEDEDTGEKVNLLVVQITEEIPGVNILEQEVTILVPKQSYLEKNVKFIEELLNIQL